MYFMQGLLYLHRKTCKIQHIMTPKKTIQNQSSLFFSLSDTLDHNHSLFVLANQIRWGVFEKKFEPKYSKDKGRPGLPIRLMVGLLMLKHIRNISDEMHSIHEFLFNKNKT